MMATMEHQGMAKSKGRPKRSQRVDVAVKIDAGVVGKAKMIATARGVTLAEYFSELLRVPVDRDFAKEMKRLADSTEPKQDV